MIAETRHPIKDWRYLDAAFDGYWPVDLLAKKYGVKPDTLRKWAKRDDKIRTMKVGHAVLLSEQDVANRVARRDTRKVA